MAFCTSNFEHCRSAVSDDEPMFGISVEALRRIEMWDLKLEFNDSVKAIK